jgi:hypothetical protein
MVRVRVGERARVGVRVRVRVGIGLRLGLGLGLGRHAAPEHGRLEDGLVSERGARVLLRLG